MKSKFPSLVPTARHERPSALFLGAPHASPKPLTVRCSLRGGEGVSLLSTLVFTPPSPPPPRVQKLSGPAKAEWNIHGTCSKPALPSDEAFSGKFRPRFTHCLQHRLALETPVPISFPFPLSVSTPVGFSTFPLTRKDNRFVTLKVFLTQDGGENISIHSNDTERTRPVVTNPEGPASGAHHLPPPLEHGLADAHARGRSGQVGARAPAAEVQEPENCVGVQTQKQQLRPPW